AADTAVSTAVVHFAAEFHFDLLHTCEGGGDTLVEQRIVGVGERVELAEIAHHALDVAGGGRVVAHLLLELCEGLHGVAIGLLVVLLTDGSVVPIAIIGAIAIAAIPGVATAIVVAVLRSASAALRAATL